MRYLQYYAENNRTQNSARIYVQPTASGWLNGPACNRKRHEQLGTDWLEREVKERDRTCVYCGTQMIEHMLHVALGEMRRRGNTSLTTQVSSVMGILHDVA